MRRSGTPRRGGDRGAAPIELALGVGLLMIPMAMLVLSFGPALEMRSFVRMAAAEASRAMIISDGDLATTSTQIAVMASNHGFDGSEVRLGLCGAAPQPVSAGGASACGTPLARGTFVEAVVTMDAPSFEVPGIGANVGGFPITTAHASRVDPYRSAELP